MIRFLVKNQETCQYVLLPLYGATSPVYATATTTAETMLLYILVQIPFIVHQTVIISSDLVTITDPPKQSSDS